MDAQERMRLAALRHALFGALGLFGGAGLGCGGKAIIDGNGSVGECAGAVAVPAKNGAKSGYRRCPDGTVHRSEALGCDASVNGTSCDGTEANLACTNDAACTAGLHGRCLHFPDQFGGGTSCGCIYSCANDGECDADQVCACGGLSGFTGDTAQCVPASCRTGADCPSGECGLSSFNDGCFDHVALGCRAPDDSCRLDSACTSAGQRCVLSTQSSGWHCEGPGCTIGRPLLVAGHALAAPAMARDDWTLGGDRAERAHERELERELAHFAARLPADERSALGAHWLEVAALEHASVASFARFALELAAFGAPADLVTAAQRAAADEVRHARCAYAVASACLGHAHGPGRLALTGLAPAPSRAALVWALVLEACAGETLGVAAALALAERVTAPVLRAVHERLAADEERHAALGWRTLAWLLASGDEALRREAEAAFAAAADRYTRVPAARPARPPLPGLGLCGAEELAALRGRAFREVVLPCARGLLARPSAAAAHGANHV